MKLEMRSRNTLRVSWKTRGRDEMPLMPIDGHRYLLNALLMNRWVCLNVGPAVWRMERMSSRERILLFTSTESGSSL